MQKKHTSRLVTAAAAVVASGLFAQATVRGDIKISEIHVDASGDNPPQDFIELRSTTGGVESVNGLTLLLLEGDSGGAGGGSGVIDQILTFPGFSTNASGLFLRHSITVPVQPALPTDPTWVQDLRTSPWGHENAAITYLLVSGYTGGGIGTDLDTNNDGVLDLTPWTSVADSVGVVDGDVSADRVYGAAMGGRTSTTPSLAPTSLTALLSEASCGPRTARFTAPVSPRSTPAASGR
jgi:uncharacterized protein